MVVVLVGVVYLAVLLPVVWVCTGRPFPPSFVGQCKMQRDTCLPAYLFWRQGQTRTPLPPCFNVPSPPLPQREAHPPTTARIQQPTASAHKPPVKSIRRSQSAGTSR